MHAHPPTSTAGESVPALSTYCTRASVPDPNSLLVPVKARSRRNAALSLPAPMIQSGGNGGACMAQSVESPTLGFGPGPGLGV